MSHSLWYLDLSFFPSFVIDRNVLKTEETKLSIDGVYRVVRLSSSGMSSVRWIARFGQQMASTWQKPCGP